MPTVTLVRTQPRRVSSQLGPPRVLMLAGAPPNICTADFRAFLDDLNASTEYADWCSASPSDCANWVTYANQILAGGTPSPPAMGSPFGTALVDAGVIALAGIIPCLASHRLKANFTWSILSGGLTVQFNNTSSPGLFGFASNSWTFGDGTGTGSPAPESWSPTHVYATPGTYFVTLTVVGNDGTSDSISRAITLVESSGGGIQIDGVIF